MIDDIIDDDLTSEVELKSLDDFNSTHDFFAWANKQPYLKPEEEFELLSRIANNENDHYAFNRVFNAFMRLVISQARKYSGYKVPLEDLVQEGCVGLIKAIKGYDPSKNAKFATYAITWISSQMLEFAIKNTSIIKIATTKEDKKLFFNMNRINSLLHRDKEYSKSLSQSDVSYISKQLNISEEKVREMELRLVGNEMSKYSKMSTVSADGDNEEIDIFDSIEDELSTPEAILERAQEEYIHGKLFADAVCSLSEREQRILNTRWVNDDKMTLAQLGVELGVSTERVRQLEANAIRKIKSVIQPHCKF